MKLNKCFVDDILLSNYRGLRLEIEKRLTRSASRINKPKQQIVFLIKHYHTILTPLQQADPSQQDGEYVYSNRLLAERISSYVEQELNQAFGKLISYVQVSDK
jgi:hypothetical protein